MLARLVMFDMAGTTVFDRGDVARVMSKQFADRGLDLSQGRFTPLMGMALPLQVRQALKRAGDPQWEVKEHVDPIVADLEDRLIAHFEEKGGEVPGAMKVFDQIKKNGAYVVLDTGYTRRVADAILEKLKWKGGIIDYVVTSSEVNRPKPAPEMVWQAMKALAVDNPLHVAKVGDTPNDLIMGHTGGCAWNIGVTEGTHTLEALMPFPHTHLVPNINHIAEILMD
ncbi:MAG: HAD hydrolase-like protein [Fimbriimonadaceae bacterium]|nr:MAG: HAD hydrolase-like protein [Fimbriimonadaceae bacterium]